MRYSRLFGKTSKTEGTDLVVDSHRLLIQAGFIRESRAGRYYLLPLGLKTHKKIEEVVRRKMSLIGAQEIVAPTLHPKELWEETNRDNTVGFELITIEDRRGSNFVLGGTAEEMMIDLVRKFNISYKDLPVEIYQFSNKFRDELRASGGLLRVREFMMKDAYSYSTEEQFSEIYQKYWDAYNEIFNELGLKTDVVRADNGYIGGEYCHEFVAESKVGESRYFIDEKSGYAAHEDVAVFQKHVVEDSDDNLLPMQEVEGKGIIGVKDLAKFLKIPEEKTTKTILFEDMNGRVVAAAINGIYDINETKLQNVVGGAPLELATEETVKGVTGAKIGYAGFLNLPEEVVVVLDDSLKGRKNFEVGANRTDYHSVNVNFGRDYPEPEKFYDIAMAQEGMLSLEGGKLVEKRGIEVGNIFQNGYHYSNLMKGSEFTDENGQKQKLYAGCYGIGIGRTLAAIVEAHKDEKGIIWPESVAPFKYHLITIARSEDDESYIKSEEIYKMLVERGEEVLWDERIETRPGEKFADADLIGCPIRVVVSPKTLEQECVEVKARTEDEAKLIKISDL